MKYADCIVIGAGAAGLFCAAQVAKSGKSVTVLDNGKKIGRKILISGGGFCNFTNLEVTSQHYLCQNPHFVKSALARFSQWDFIAMVAEAGISYREKELGQLFCDNSAQDIVDMLAALCEKHAVNICLRQKIEEVVSIKSDLARFRITANGQQWQCRFLVIATGGLSMPALGATPLGYRLAERFGLAVLSPRASLVPFTYREADKYLARLAGVSLSVSVKAQSGQSFSNQLLFTHRGLSGPAILQISNYWQPTESVEIDLLPGENITACLMNFKIQSPKLRLETALTRLLPKKLVELWGERGLIGEEILADLSKPRCQKLEFLIHRWQFQPNGTEGYRTAEVTLGGVDTRGISSKTMEANQVKGLYFIGEVLDVTGWLGGYNFQWAWSSAYACAEGIAENSE